MVSARVRDALAQIDKVHTTLASHLRSTLQMGRTVCSYTPLEPTLGTSSDSHEALMTVAILRPHLIDLCDEVSSHVPEWLRRGSCNSLRTGT